MFRRQAILSHPSCRTPPEDVLDTFIRSGRMKKMLKLVGAAIALALPSVAVGQVLNFEGIVPSGSAFAPVGNWYNGGAGPNYGISFSANALAGCLKSTSGPPCINNGSRGGLGDPNSQNGALFFLTGPATYMSRSAGFTSGFSFFYTALGSPGAFSVWSGMDGTGSLLATLTLPVTGNGSSVPNCLGTAFCPFDPIGVNFAGTAESVSFAGVANHIVFDDVTFGSSTPGTTVPEPASIALLGTGLVGVFGAARRRRKSA